MQVCMCVNMRHEGHSRRGTIVEVAATVWSLMLKITKYANV